MRVIVIGAGEVGLNLARTLVTDGHSVTMVDSSPARCTTLEGELDALVIEGNGASPRVLREVGVENADLVAAVTQIDEANLIAAMGAKQINPKMTTVARVRDPDFARANGHEQERGVRGPFGIDFVIDPDHATARDIAEAILLPGAVSVEYFGDDRLGLAEVIVGADSPLIGQPLALRERAAPSYIVGWSRGGSAKLAEGEDVLEAGDHLIVVAATDNLAATVATFAGKARKVKRCIVFGGGRIGLRLARIFEPEPISVTVLEREAERARTVAERLGNTLVLHEEGLSRDAMLQSGVDEADAFVACAGDDRANLLAALNAKRLGADLCVSVVSREEFVPLVDALDLDAAFSPRLITAEAILRFVHTRALRAMHLLRSGFEALELEVESGSRIAGRELGRTGGLLRGCRVGAILRDEQVLIPDVGSEIKAGDRVLMLGVEGTLRDVEPTFTASS
jgi:trk system potassium uptake protein TrkA